MPVFAFTAGSLGDILALLGLARRLSSSLSNLSTETGGLRELLEDIELFTRAINQVKEALDRRQIGMQQDVLLGIKHHLQICYSILLVVDGKVAAFNAKMTGQGRLRMEALRKYWAVAAWEILGGREQVNTLRARLRDQVTAIHTYLALAQSHDQRSVLDAARSQHVRADRILSAIQDLQRRFGRATIPSFQFQNPDTSTCYGPCARTSIQNILHLFGPINIYFPDGRVGVAVSAKHIYDYITDYPSAELFLGVAGIWRHSLSYSSRGASVECCFYRGEFDCIEVLVGIPPLTAGDSDTTASRSLYRDLIMAGHLDIKSPGTDRASYATIRERGRYVERLQSTYQELWDRYYKLRFAINFLLLRSIDQLKAILNTFPDPAILEGTVLPRVRHICSLDPSTLTPAVIDEIQNLVDVCPRLDKTRIEELELDQGRTMLSGLHNRVIITFSGKAVTLFRAAARVPVFWEGL